MGELNEFRLSYETSFLFVLSHEYDIALAKLLSMYALSDKIFWAYMSLLAPMSKMGVRKSNQLAKVANRLYKKIRNLQDKYKRKIEEDEYDEDGNIVLDEKGKPKKIKRTIIEYTPIVLTDEENKLLDVMKYYTTRGYSNGDVFYDDDEILDINAIISTNENTITVKGEQFLRCTKIEYIVEKYLPDLSIPEFRTLSVKQIGDLIGKLKMQENLEEKPSEFCKCGD